MATLAAATNGLVSGMGLEVLTQEGPDFKGGFKKRLKLWWGDC